MKKLYLYLAFILTVNSVLIFNTFFNTSAQTPTQDLAPVAEIHTLYHPDLQDSFNIHTLEEWYGVYVQDTIYLDPSVIPYEDLRLLTVLHHGFDGMIHEGEIIVNKQIAEEVIAIFKELYEIGFPIESIQPIHEFDNDDYASMEANNTHGFNFRKIEGTNRWSQHAFGLAIDINPLRNPFIQGDLVKPALASDFVNRDQETPGMIHNGSDIHEIFTRQGWIWGGDWDAYGIRDYHHFERPIR